MSSNYFRSRLYLPNVFPGSLSIEPLIDTKWHFECLVRSPSSLNQRSNILTSYTGKSKFNQSTNNVLDSTSPLGESSLSPRSQEIVVSESHATSSRNIRAANSENVLKSFQDVVDDSDSEIEEFCKVFEIFDKNGDGKLSTDEIKESLDKLGLKVTQKELESMMVAIDSNGNGFVDLEEFLALYRMQTDAGSTKCVIEEHDEGFLKRAFGVFDQNNDGFITANELQTVLSNLGPPQETCKLVDCRNMIRGADLDGDGKINFMEFKLMMSPRRLRCRAESNSFEKSLSTIQVSFLRNPGAQL